MNGISVALVAVFVLTALVSMILVRYCSNIEDKDSRKGLKFTLLISSIWCLTEALQLLIIDQTIIEYIHLVNLSFGVTSVLSWMYFASAFSKSDYHQIKKYRYGALVSLIIVLVAKITNPIHHLYFKTSVVTEPFTYVSIEHFFVHDVIVSIAYLVSFYGIYLVYRGLNSRGGSKKNILPLILSLAIPSTVSILTRVDYLIPNISGISLDPVGVVLFSLIILFVYSSNYNEFYEQSRSRFLDNLDRNALIIDKENKIVDFNTNASRLLNIGQEDLGKKVSDLIDLDCEIQNPETVEIEGRIYSPELISYNKINLENSKILFLKDQTDIILKNRMIDRQRSQFNELSEGISHEIRNGLQILNGHTDVIESTGGLTDDQIDSLETIRSTCDRIDRVSDDLRQLAEMGNKDVNIKDINLSKIFDNHSTKSSIDIEHSVSCSVSADPSQISILVEKAIELAEKTGSKSIEFESDGGSLRISHDGIQIKEENFKKAFEYGKAVPSAKTGSILPVVKTVSDTHGWDINQIENTQSTFEYEILMSDS